MARKATPRKKVTSPRKAAAKKPAAKKAAPTKAAAKKAAPARKTIRRARSARPSVKVRMYRQGLGDCFLLTLPSESGRPFFMMIDCGVLVGTNQGADEMKGVVQDIIDTTGGQVDIVVATHLHWDHLSGFFQARGLFAEPGNGNGKGKLRVERLWLAWTEDPTNRLANSLRARRQQREQALRATVQSLRAMGAEVAREQALRANDLSLPAADAGAAPGVGAADQVEDLLGFFGAAGGGGTEEALDALRSYSRKAPRFCRPKNAPITLPEIPGVRFFVLGPPEDEKLIKRSDPSRSHPEVYEEPGRALNLENAFFAAVLPGDDSEMKEASFPFDRCYQIPAEQAKQTRFFQQYYFDEDPDPDAKYRDQSWRAIGTDWLNQANQLALQLDSDTNNTSLALAIELIESGKVLLFPADAQVGNWLSWADLSWTVGGRKVEAVDLLSRTVLYKVGHHGSHNATLRDQGLEKMESEDLIALIPVDQEMAKKKKWNMPFPPLLHRLMEKTNGRVLRVDDSEKVAQRKAPKDVPASLWRAFQDSVTESESTTLAKRPLYYEVTIEL